MSKEIKGIIDELREIVGKEYVTDDPEEIEQQLLDYSFASKKMALCVVYPKDLHEVQKIVQLAIKDNIPVTPRSSDIGFYGDGIPDQGGIIVKLTRMNKILTVNERNRAARIQPGVEWKQLQEELKKYKLRAILTLLPHPKKSVLTAYLERYPFIFPKFEYSEPLTTMEVVLPNGNIFRTGAAAGPGEPEEAPESAALVQPLGPGCVDFYRLFQGAQGTLAILTWGTVRVEPLPVLEKLFFITFEDLDDAIEPIYQIQRRMFGYESFLLNKFNFALIMAEDWLADSEKLIKNLPPWILIFNIGAGYKYPEEKVAYEEEALMEIANKLNFKPTQTLVRIEGLDKKLLQMLKGPWEKEPYWKFRFKNRCCDIFFLTTLDKVAEFDKKVKLKAEELEYPPNEIGCYIQPIEYGRACHVEYNFFYNRENTDELKRVKNLYEVISELIYSMGGVFSRPYGKWVEFIVQRSSVYTDTMKKVKKIFDPDNILNPGKLF